MYNRAIPQLCLILCPPRVCLPSVTACHCHRATSCISWAIPLFLMTCSSHNRHNMLLKGYQSVLISVFKIRVCRIALSAGRWFQEAGPGMIRNSDLKEDNTDSSRETAGPCTVETPSQRVGKNMKEGSVWSRRGHKMAFYLQTCLRGRAVQWVVTRLRF